MVVTCLPATPEIWVWHEKARLPSMCTTQAPHRPAPQPNLVPVSLSCSRITQSSGVSCGASTLTGAPFILKLTDTCIPPEPIRRFTEIKPRAISQYEIRVVPTACAHDASPLSAFEFGMHFRQSRLRTAD